MFHAGFGGDAKRTLAALGRSMAIIEFEPDGKIITANENFCRALGYDLEEIKGKHHSMFVEPDYARSVEYREFWAKLGRGEFDAREYKRIGKGGKEVWIQASYSPVLSASGKVVKVVKAASDVTAAKMQNAENSGKLDAISRAQAVIEFTIDGKILTANENFLNVLGYRLDEVQGQHHRMFVEPAYAQSAEYQEFWRKLDRGEFVADEFKRIGKGGKEIWIQASYNPIFDLNKRVVKVVKFATDVTGRVNAVNAIATRAQPLGRGRLESASTCDFIPVARSAPRRLQRVDRDARALDGGDQRQHASHPLGDRRNLRRPRTTSRVAPSSRPRASKRPPPRSKRSRRPSRRPPKAPSTRATSSRPPRSTPTRAARSCARRRRRCPASRSPRSRSARSSA